MENLQRGSDSISVCERHLNSRVLKGNVMDEQRNLELCGDYVQLSKPRSLSLSKKVDIIMRCHQCF